MLIFFIFDGLHVSAILASCHSLSAERAGRNLCEIDDMIYEKWDYIKLFHVKRIAAYHKAYSEAAAILRRMRRANATLKVLNAFTHSFFCARTITECRPAASAVIYCLDFRLVMMTAIFAYGHSGERRSTLFLIPSLSIDDASFDSFLM